MVFVRVAGHSDYFYEQPLHFDPAHTWQANRVVVGDSTSAGQKFELHVYVVSDEYAQELAKHDGMPYSVRNVPGERLAWTSVQRNDKLGNC
ncbi:hypothetical protein [Micromonospora sp. SH-82]|uniref:hypothetical protein n=1 Tax=Micromonospora sp. SH-82 TaxID=3132938 RepID=UPI003EB6FA89